MRDFACCGVLINNGAFRREKPLGRRTQLNAMIKHPARGGTRSSKAALFGQQAAKQQVAAAPREGAGITQPNYALFLKPWLSPQRPGVTPATEPQFVAADKYNSKKGARGEQGPKFQIAPLK